MTLKQSTRTKPSSKKKRRSSMIVWMIGSLAVVSGLLICLNVGHLHHQASLTATLTGSNRLWESFTSYASSNHHGKTNESSSFLSKHYDVCIVGAGLSGSVLAERYAAELQANVLVLEKRNHIGGNCYDYIDIDTNIRVSQYGAHLFHTNDKTVWNYVQQFGKWIPYEHQVKGVVNGKLVPIPVNIETVNSLFNVTMTTKGEMEAWLQKEQIPLKDKKNATNSEQVALSRVGKRLYDLIFKPYTLKQWNRYPDQLGPEVLSRIPVHNDHENRYFLDPYQALPAAGYTSIFERMLSSSMITVQLNMDYFAVKDKLQCDKTYYTGPIDTYFASTGWPKLEYRSLEFERVVQKNVDYFQPVFVVNHPQTSSGDYTRIVEYKHLPYNQVHKSNDTIYFIERSKDTGEPYYPVPNPKNEQLYAKYQALAQQDSNVTFVGRLANYKYFNMDQAIKNALNLFAEDTGIEFVHNSINDAKRETVGRKHQVFRGQVVEKDLVSYADSQKLLVHYSNSPPVEMTRTLQDQVQKALSLPVDKPYGLRHKAYPPGNNAVMGLAAYPENIKAFRLLVGSLRENGYDGHIILGVHKQIPFHEEEYLKAMHVTYYIVDFVDCDKSIMDAGDGGGVIRGKCAKGLEKLKLEWGRFEMCRQWLHDCKECTGWTLIMDTRDIFFQADPFASLPPADKAKEDLLLVEEIAPHSNPQPDRPIRADVIGRARYTWRTEPCYGEKHYQSFYNRPVLCSGTVIGTRSGMHRFLSVLVGEFYSNNAKPNTKCRSPHNTDQWTMNYLYYTGRFGFFNQTKTLAWGTGPVNTIGTPCYDRAKTGPDKHSQDDLILFDSKGRILNIHEPVQSKARVASTVHQYDRCHNWIIPWLSNHSELSQKRNNKDFIPVEELSLPWKVPKQQNL